MIASMYHPCCKGDEVDADRALEKERALCIAFICHVNRFLNNTPYKSKQISR